MFVTSGGGENMGLHSAPDGGGDPDEKEEEELHHPETPAKDSSHTAEEPG